MIKKLYFSLFPKKCPGCGKLVRTEEFFCKECFSSLPFIEGVICPDCGAAKEDCSCGKEKNKFDFVISPFYYEGAAKLAVLKLKSYPIYAEGLADECVRALKEHFDLSEFDFVCNVPMSGSKLKQHGFNHSEALAKLIAQKIAVPYFEPLEVLYDTPPQHSLDFAGRSGNVRGIYDIKEEFEEKIEGKNILLVDDIKTSGATLNECALMLKLYGAESVKCVVAALRKQKLDERKK